MTEVAAESTAVSRTGSTTLVKTVTETYDYVYNGDRLSQVKKTTSTTTSSGTTSATDTLNFTYDANGTPMSVKYNGTMYYFVTNLQGDVTAILNTSGTAVASYTYDAWGNILTTGGSMASTLGTLNPLRYRGYVYDTETGLYYLQSRYYNPIRGRFINEDAFASTGQGLLGNNMFAYCNCNPVNNADMDGLIPRSVTGAEYTDSDVWNKKRAAKILVKNTKVTAGSVTKDGETYVTYNADIESERFSTWKNDIKQLKEVTQYYADYLHQRIERKMDQDDADKYWTMSENHIYAETMAHVTIWFYSGRLVKSTEIVNLNVDENRPKARVPMWIWGYDPSSDELEVRG